MPRRALALPGVVAVIDGRDTGAELEPMVFDIAKIVPPRVQEATNPLVRVHPMPALPRERVTYAGQPVLAVLAVDRYVAEDALELVDVELEALPAVVEAVAALEPDAPLVEPELGGQPGDVRSPSSAATSRRPSRRPRWWWRRSSSPSASTARRSRRAG